MKKRILIIFFTFILFCTICNNVFASNFNTEIVIDSKTSNELVLVLKVADVNFNNTMSTIEGNIEYDKNIFEKVTIENLNGWSIVYNSEEKANGKFIGFKVSNEKIKQEELCKITLKLKENVKNSNTQISIKNTKSADGDNLVATQDKTINVDIANSSITNTKEEKDLVSNKSVLKYVLILVIIVLLLTIVTSSSYLVLKYKLNKKYNKIVKNKK